MLRRRRLRRRRSGGFRLELPGEERDLLTRLLPQFREIVELPPEDPRVRRLYPTAFPDDPEKEAEYQRFMHSELVASRTAAIDAVEASLDAKELDEAQALAWMGAVNTVRLVLGTMLDVDEELDLGRLPADDPDIESYALYAYLSLLLEELVAALERS